MGKTWFEVGKQQYPAFVIPPFLRAESPIKLNLTILKNTWLREIFTQYA